MLLTLHAATGALVGEYATSGSMAFVLGFVSHFLLDMFPHGDRRLGNETKATGRAGRYYWFLIADSAVGLAIFLPAFLLGRFDRPWFAYLGLLGGLLPDILVAIPQYALYVKREYRVRLHWFYKLHVFVHDRIIRTFDGMPLRVGIAIQVVLFVALWRVLVR